MHSPLRSAIFSQHYGVSPFTPLSQWKIVTQLMVTSISIECGAYSLQITQCNQLRFASILTVVIFSLPRSCGKGGLCKEQEDGSQRTNPTNDLIISGWVCKTLLVCGNLDYSGAVFSWTVERAGFDDTYLPIQNLSNNIAGTLWIEHIAV